MPTSIEREKVPSAPEGVVEHIETPEIPEHIEKGGVIKRPSDFTAQVTDDNGEPLIKPSPDGIPQIKLPQPKDTLEEWKKGSPEDARTGFAHFWLRALKKAIHKIRGKK
jgi:hypothetical protein